MKSEQVDDSPPPTSRYVAFLSYSHADKAIAAWLHRAMETYRVPKALRNATPRGKPLPQRVMPVFRDEDEMPASSDLGESLREALRASEVLVVLCSPDSARSRWVNEEIRYFQGLGRSDRIIGLIVRGAPHAAVAAEECFPPALRYKAGVGGENEELTEPVAANLGVTRQGRLKALLRVVAGVLGVRYDDLYEREKRRQRRRRWQVAVTVLAGLAAIVAGWKWQQLEAEAQLNKQKQEAALRLQNEQEGARKEQELQELRRLADLKKLQQQKDARAALVQAAARLTEGDPLAAVSSLKTAQELDEGHAAIPVMRGLATRGLSGLQFATQATQERMLELRTHPRLPRCVTIDAADVARVWDLEKGALLATFDSKAHGGRQIHDARWNPDGICVALLMDDLQASIVLLDVGKGTTTKMPGHADYCAGFLPNGKLVTLTGVAKEDRTLLNYWLPGEKSVTPGVVLDAKVFGIHAVTPDARFMVLRVNQKNVWKTCWFATETGKILALIEESRLSSWNPALSDDGSRLAIPDATGQWQILSQDGSAKPMKEMRPMSEGSMFHSPVLPHTAAFARNTGLLFTFNQGGTDALWDAGTAAALGVWESHLVDDETRGFAVHPSGECVAEFSRRGTVRLRRMADGNPIGTFMDSLDRRAQNDMFAPVSHGIAFTSDGGRLIISEDSGSVRVWDWQVAAQGQTEHALPAAEKAGLPASKFQVRIDEQGRLCAMDGPSSRALMAPMQLTSASLSASISDDGTRVLSVAKDGGITVWSVPDGARVCEILSSGTLVNQACFSPDGRTIAGACTSASCMLWNALDGHVEGTLVDARREQPERFSGKMFPSPLPPGAASNDGFMRVAFAEDGKWLAVGCDQGCVSIWYLPEAMQVLHRFVGSGFVTELAWEPGQKGFRARTSASKVEAFISMGEAAPEVIAKLGALRR